MDKEINSTLKNKNILVITENYAFGGLETHLGSKIKFLSKNGYNIFLVVGTTFYDENLPHKFCERIYTGFDFSANLSSKQTEKLINQLLKIIKEHEIDIIDAHPFFSVLPAFFSAYLANIPFVYTMHGPASIMDGYGIFTEWLMKFVVLEHASLINNVSPETSYLVKNFVKNSNSKVFRNAVDLDEFYPTNHNNTAFEKCCVVSRLDNAKVSGIKEFLKIAADTNIIKVDIYGNGPEYFSLKSWIEETIDKAKLTVELKGYTLDVKNVLKDYSIVAGMGRVVLEAAAMDIPVILVGYDGVKGLLNQELIENASFANISGRGITNIDSTFLLNQLNNLAVDATSYRLSGWVDQHANLARVWSEYSTHLQTLECNYSDLVFDIYQCFTSCCSEGSYLYDENLMQQIRSTLRSSKYLGTNAYRYIYDFDFRSIMYTISVKQDSTENIVKQHVDLSTDRILSQLDYFKNVCLEKERELNLSKKEVEELRKQNFELRALTNSLNLSHDTANKNITELQAQNQTFKADLIDLLKAKVKLEEEIKLSNMKITTLESNLLNSIKAEKQVEEKITDQILHIAKLEKEVASSLNLYNEVKENEVAKDIQIAKLESTIEYLSQEKSDLERQFLGNMSLITNLKTRLSIILKEKLELKQYIDIQNSQVKHLERKVFDFEQKQIEAHDLVKSLESELQSKDSEIAQYKVYYEERNLFGIIKDKAYKVISNK